MNRSKPKATGRSSAFSLLEVVAAVGIFAIGMVAVVGLFAPVAKSVSNLADTEAATNVAGLLSDHLRRQPFLDVAALLKVSTGANTHQLTDADNAPNSTAADPTKDTQLLFASRDGTKIGAYNDPVWANLDVEKYFEIALIRREEVSPTPTTTTDADGVVTVNNPDSAAAFLAYTARVRWPAFVPDATSTRRALPAGYNPSGNLRFDNSLKQVFFFSGTVPR
ncbi:MAG: hypothetical protein NTV51_03300 [Verrucomicrobia bacterium]|nr:hypothetical protein [Verrucomicrobiota bacterium]